MVAVDRLKAIMAKCLKYLLRIVVFLRMLWVIFLFALIVMVPPADRINDDNEHKCSYRIPFIVMAFTGAVAQSIIAAAWRFLTGLTATYVLLGMTVHSTISTGFLLQTASESSSDYAHCRNTFWVYTLIFDVLPLLAFIAYGINLAIFLALASAKARWADPSKPYCLWLWGRWYVFLTSSEQMRLVQYHLAENSDVHRGLVTHPFLPWFLDEWYRIRYSLGEKLFFMLVDRNTYSRTRRKQETVDGLQSVQILDDTYEHIAGFIAGQEELREKAQQAAIAVIASAFEPALEVDMSTCTLVDKYNSSRPNPCDSSKDVLADMVGKSVDKLHHIAVGGNMLWRGVQVVAAYVNRNGVNDEPERVVKAAFVESKLSFPYQFTVCKLPTYLDTLFSDPVPAGTVLVTRIPQLADNFDDLFLSCAGKEFVLKLLGESVRQAHPLMVRHNHPLAHKPVQPVLAHHTRDELKRDVSSSDVNDGDVQLIAIPRPYKK